MSKQQGGGKAIAYDAFGVPIRGLSLSGNDSTSSQGSDWWSPYSESSPGSTDNLAQRYAYNGKVLDKATGMYDYGFRHYAAQIGRFTTVDPIKDGLHWYAYVGNDPVNYVDLLGLEASDSASLQRPAGQRARLSFAGFR